MTGPWHPEKEKVKEAAAPERHLVGLTVRKEDVGSAASAMRIAAVRKIAKTESAMPALQRTRSQLIVTPSTAQPSAMLLY